MLPVSQGYRDSNDPATPHLRTRRHPRVRRLRFGASVELGANESLTGCCVVFVYPRVDALHHGRHRCSGKDEQFRLARICGVSDGDQKCAECNRAASDTHRRSRPKAHRRIQADASRYFIERDDTVAHMHWQVWRTEA